MSTLRVNTLQNASGTGQPDMVGAAKAWVNFNGTGVVAIRASFNVSSITDNGTGDYTVNFTTALANANYSAVVSVSESASNSVTIAYLRWNLAAPTASAYRVQTTNDAGTSLDMPYICSAVFR